MASWSITNIFCFVVFGLCIVFALLMGCKPGAYWNLLRDPAHGVDFSKKFGKAAMLMNVGLYGLFIVLYYNIIGATFNAVTFGCIFCMLACCNSGSNPKTVWPIMIGYVAASYLMGWLAGLAGGTFAPGDQCPGHCGGSVLCQRAVSHLREVWLAHRHSGRRPPLLPGDQRASAARRLLPV